MYFKTLGNIMFRNKCYDAEKLRYWINVIRDNLSQKVIQGSVVGIVGERSALLVCVIIACIEENITFVPIDKDIPHNRMDYMLKNSGAKYLIGDKKYYHHLINENQVFIDVETLLEEDRLNGSYVQGNKITTFNPVYILYTSGSTGKPKGVVISYEGFENFLSAVPEKIPFIKGKNISCFTSISFDIVFLEMILGISKGMNLILADDEERTNPKSILRLINTYGLDILQITPSMLGMIKVYNDNSLDFLENVEKLLLGGEKLTDTLLEEVHSFSHCMVFNMYGPTETTIWSTISNLSDKCVSDLGDPILGTTLYLVNENNEPVEEGQEGELVIGGKGLAIGYVNDSQMTNERFINLSYGEHERVYKTGDMCKYDAEKRLIFLGRIDNQVKINGHRIELEEIEYCLKKQYEIKDAVVCAYNGILACFYISEYDLDINNIKEKLSNFLPQYMIPSFFNRVKRFEYTVSHKIDKKKMIESLSKTCSQKIITSSQEINGNAEYYEKKIKELVSRKECVSDSEITAESELKKLGFDSIGFISLIVDIENQFGIEFDEDSLTIDKFVTLQSIIDYVSYKMMIAI